MEVRVVEATFDDNGKVSNPLTDEHPPWLADAFKFKQIGLIRLDDNRAVLAIKTNKGLQVAEAGDKISNDLMYGLVLEKKSTNALTWEIVEKILQEREKGFSK